MNEQEKRIIEDEVIAGLKWQLKEKDRQLQNVHEDMECLRSMGDNQCQLINVLNTKIASYRKGLSYYAHPEKFDYDNGQVARDVLTEMEGLSVIYYEQKKTPHTKAM